MTQEDIFLCVGRLYLETQAVVSSLKRQLEELRRERDQALELLKENKFSEEGPR